MKISLCLIVKNEQEHLARCLDSLYQHVDEIIITDTGSTDNTLEIAKKYTDKIYHFEWIDDFSAARNYCQSYATWDYILWMDADEWFLKKDILMLRKWLLQYPDRDLFSINIIHIDTSGKKCNIEEKFKIYKNNGKYMWRWKIHEIIDTKNSSVTSGDEVFLSNVSFYHSLKHAWKSWSDIEYFKKHFQREKENNTVALFLLHHYLEKWKSQEICTIIKKIPYVHWRFWWFFTAYSKKLKAIWYVNEAVFIEILIKKSIMIYKRLWKDS